MRIKAANLLEQSKDIRRKSTRTLQHMEKIRDTVLNMQYNIDKLNPFRGVYREPFR